LFVSPVVLETYAAENANLNDSLCRKHLNTWVVAVFWVANKTDPAIIRAWQEHPGSIHPGYFLIACCCATCDTQTLGVDQDCDHEAIKRNTMFYVDISGEP
jgi:hypothetical protein